MRIIITCGYNQSLHAISLISELKKRGHQLVGCIIVRTVQLKRLKTKIKMYGLRDVLKKFQNAVLNSKNDFNKETYYIKQYMKKNEIDFKKVNLICKRLNIPYIRVDNLNEKKSCLFLKEMNNDLVVYAGGGILRKNFIKVPNIGILNAHSGKLPFFRGMNVIEWSLLYNVKPTVTVHMISEGIDTGDILFQKSIPVKNNYSIVDLRGVAVVTEVESLIDVLSNFDEIFNNRTNQNTISGKQFFIMHERLVAIAGKNIPSFDDSK